MRTLTLRPLTAAASFLTLAALAALAAPGARAQVFFTDRAAFNAAAGGGLSFESFETPFAPAPTVNFPGFSISETGAISNTVFSDPFGATDGSLAAVYRDNDNSVSTFAFTSPVTAFGLDVTTSTATTVLVGGDISSSFSLFANTPQFFGVISTTPFSTVTFNASGPPEVGFDAVSFGTAAVGVVPEPGTLALVGTGLLPLAGVVVRRRRRG